MTNIATAAPREDFRRSERVVVLVGAGAAGALFGFALALAMGRTNPAVVALAVGPALALSAWLALGIVREGISRGAIGCSAAAGMHVAALALWPLAHLMAAPIEQVLMAPLLAAATLVLLASCWTGSAAIVYRAAGQGLAVAALAGLLGGMAVMA